MTTPTNQVLWATLIGDATQPVAATSATELNVVETVLQGGPIGILTMGILVFFSVVSWAIIGHKFFFLRRASSETAGFLKAFWDAKRLDQMYQDAETYPRSPLSHLFRSGYVELARLRKSGESSSDSSEDLDSVERALRRSQQAELTTLEKFTSFLATVGATAPFIGLFGTVWGIMRAFRDIGRMGSANLATVAPGISEALIATAAGLAAAIPAVIAYNYFLARVRILGAEMETFSSDFLNIVRRHFLR